MTRFEPHRGRMVGNLLRVYQKANAEDLRLGRRFYSDGKSLVGWWARAFTLPVQCVANMIAAISPQCNWQQNVVIASHLLHGTGKVPGGALPRNVRKARRILNEQATDITKYFPQGPKVTAFARNLAGDLSYPTIDGHAMQAALDDVTADFKLDWPRYKVFAECYIQAAAFAGVPVAEFQAVVWYTWKRLHPPEEKRRARREANRVKK